jgi:hypothetical protein
MMFFWPDYDDDSDPEFALMLAEWIVYLKALVFGFFTIIAGSISSILGVFGFFFVIALIAVGIAIHMVKSLVAVCIVGVIQIYFLLYGIYEMLLHKFGHTYSADALWVLWDLFLFWLVVNAIRAALHIRG